MVDVVGAGSVKRIGKVVGVLVVIVFGLTEYDVNVVKCMNEFEVTFPFVVVDVERVVLLALKFLVVVEYILSVVVVLDLVSTVVFVLLGLGFISVE